MTPGLRIDPNNERHFGRWFILFVIAILLIVGSYYGYQWYTKGDVPPIVPVPAQALADPSIDETPITPAQVTEHSVAATSPRYLSIPLLGIDKVRVVSVGLTKNNILDTPKNINDTAWYDKSANPGSGSGAVVIDGHNGGITKNGVFAKLADLTQGSEIIVERGDGKKITYVVETNATMSLKEANTTGMKDMMQSIEPSKEGLSLITCAGNWVPRDKIFDKRVMVRAVAEE
ncbi:class F sortase [Candidatus Saccharibacteria bacterium]|nr:class F sortase [Candidatus Saccharibacteria bacterium]